MFKKIDWEKESLDIKKDVEKTLYNFSRGGVYGASIRAAFRKENPVVVFSHKPLFSGKRWIFFLKRLSDDLYNIRIEIEVVVEVFEDEEKEEINIPPHIQKKVAQKLAMFSNYDGAYYFFCKKIGEYI